MDNIRSIPAKAVYELFRCGLCYGFVVEPVSLPECHHIFCRTCIVQHCATLPAHCPTLLCNALIHKSKPLRVIKNDAVLKTLQCKLLPEVYMDELRRREAFALTSTAAEATEVGASMVDGSAIPDNTEAKPLFPWMRPIPVLMEVLLQYSVEHGAKERCFEPCRMSSKPRAMMLPNHATVSIVRRYLQLKYSVKQLDQIVLLHQNSPVDDGLQMSHFIRFDLVQTAVIELSFFFVDFAGETDPLGRVACVQKILQQRVPQKVPCQKKRTARASTAQSTPVTAVTVRPNFRPNSTASSRSGEVMGEETLSQEAEMKLLAGVGIDIIDDSCFPTLDVSAISIEHVTCMVSKSLKAEPDPFLHGSTATMGY